MSILGGLTQGIQGAIAYEDAKAELAALPEYKDYNPISEYSNLYGQVSRLANDPFSGSSNAAFNQMLAESTQTGMRQTQAIDPSIAGSALAGMNMSGTQQRAGREMQGEAARFSYLQMLGQMTQDFQRLSDMNVQGYNQRLHTKELSLEQLKQAARQRSEAGFVEVGDASEAAVAEVFSMLYGMGGGGKSVQQTPDPTAGSFNQSNPYMGVGGSGGAAGSGAGGLGGVGGSGGAAGAGFCWVARAAYGEHDPRWKVFRSWLLNEAPSWLRNLYMKHGEAFAGVVEKSKALRVVVRSLMDTVVVPRQADIRLYA